MRELSISPAPSQQTVSHLPPGLGLRSDSRSFDEIWPLIEMPDFEPAVLEPVPPQREPSPPPREPSSSSCEPVPLCEPPCESLSQCDPLDELFSPGGTAADAYDPIEALPDELYSPGGTATGSYDAFADGTVSMRVRMRHEVARTSADGIGVRVHERHTAAQQAMAAIESHHSADGEWSGNADWLDSGSAAYHDELEEWSETPSGTTASSHLRQPLSQGGDLD